jgi:signal transduction histidine kinase
LSFCGIQKRGWCVVKEERRIVNLSPSTAELAIFPACSCFPLMFSRLHGGVWLVLAALVVTEVAVLVPSIVTQRGADDKASRAQLNVVHARFVTAVSNRLAALIYNTARTAATASLVANMTQDALKKSIQLPLNPSQSTDELFVWIPRVYDEDRAAFEAFYGFPITHHNGTVFYPAERRPVYYPYTLFEPCTSYTRYIEGFDLLSDNRSAIYLTNMTLHLQPHSALNRTTPNTFGIAIVVQEETGKGYALGLTSVEDLLAASVVVDRREVTLAAYDASARPALQLLFLDNSPALSNATTVAEFNLLQRRDEFLVSNATVLGDDIMLAALYSTAVVVAYSNQQWIVLVAVLVPVCVVIDAVFIVLALLWQNRLEAQKRERKKREATQLLLAYINHEIRNPLQTILGLGDWCVEQLHEMDGTERLVSDVSTIIRSAEFIEHIASDILDIQRIEEGKITLDVTDVNVRLLVSNLEKSVQQLSKKNVAFKVVCDFGIVSVIRTDRYRLEQILMNFLSNAFKHTVAGSVTLSFAYTAPGMLRISVADTGKGIPDELKGVIFEQFGQVSARDATQLGGFGLGLFLTKVMAKLLGGSVGFTSEFGVGSVFYLELPVDKDCSAQFDESALSLGAP